MSHHLRAPEEMASSAGGGHLRRRWRRGLPASAPEARSGHFGPKCTSNPVQLSHFNRPPRQEVAAGEDGEGIQLHVLPRITRLR